MSPETQSISPNQEPKTMVTSSNHFRVTRNPINQPQSRTKDHGYFIKPLPCHQKPNQSAPIKNQRPWLLYQTTSMSPETQPISPNQEPKTMVTSSNHFHVTRNYQTQ
jgi:hypothetical protein